MSVANRIWLGPTGSEELLNSTGKCPVHIREGELDIRREGRVANGDYVADTIATKKRFALVYQVVDQDELDIILTEWKRGTTLNLKVERKDTTIDEYTVRVEPFSRRRIMAMDRWLYDGVTLNIEEV